VLEPHASVGDLVVTAERVMRDTYCIMERFQAQAVEGLSGDFWEPVMSGGAETLSLAQQSELWVMGLI
jgi:hypothetical protein